MNYLHRCNKVYNGKVPKWMWKERTKMQRTSSCRRTIPFSLIVPRPRRVLLSDLIELLHQDGCWKEERERERVEGGWRRVVRETSGQIAPSARLFLPLIPFMQPPHPKPSILICPVSQIPSHVTIGQLYNRGHPTFRLHSVFFGIVASAQSITDECIVNGSKYFQH